MVSALGREVFGKFMYRSWQGIEMPHKLPVRDYLVDQQSIGLKLTLECLSSRGHNYIKKSPIRYLMGVLLMMLGRPFALFFDFDNLIRYGSILISELSAARTCTVHSSNYYTNKVYCSRTRILLGDPTQLNFSQRQLPRV